MRKILSVILIAISAIMLGLSLAGLVMVSIYKAPLIQVSTVRLHAVGNELEQAQTAIKNAKLELERTQRLVLATETGLANLKTEFEQAKKVFDSLEGAINNQLIPGMNTFREKLAQAKNGLQQLKQTLEQINSLPLMNFNISGDGLLMGMIGNTDLLDAQIVQVEDSVKKTATFMNDASYLIGADFTETKANLENFLRVVTEYDLKLTGWRAQLTSVEQQLPVWIGGAATGLTIFLLWFGFSQFGLIVHGLNLWRNAQLHKPSSPSMVDDV